MIETLNSTQANDKHILVIGDSITKGVTYDETRARHIMLKDNVIAIIKSKLAAIFDCYSRFGCTISTAYDVLTDKLRGITAETKPEFAIIEIGGNDCDFDWQAVAQNPEFDHKPHTTLPAYKDTLTRMIDDIRECGIEPVLVNLPPIDADRYFNYFTAGDKKMGEAVLKWLGQAGRIYWWHERYNAAVEYIGEITKTAVINVRQAFLNEENYREFISSDGIHPNANGYALIADAILNHVARRAPALAL